MAVYDHVISSASMQSLTMLLLGALAALTAEVTLRHLRSKSLSYFGARVDHFVSCAVFERLMFLAPVYTERSSVSGHLARLRDFESVREFFTGPLASLFFEMPLVAIYLTAMVIISGWLAIVPLILLAAYGILILATRSSIRENSRASANTASQRHEFLLETMTKLQDIRLSGMEETWEKRFHELSRRAALTSFHASLSAQTLETISYVLMTLGGVAPLQMACASMTRVQQLGASVRQVQRLLTVAPEHMPYTTPTALTAPEGRITFHRVSLRYTSDSEPALLGLSFEARPGQIIAIKGNNGSGKSSILKLVLGLYIPQGGSVRLDGVDLRQLDPIALRQAISYVPQNADLFPGTIRDNLLLANPAANLEDIHRALHLACALEEVDALPRGLDTPIAGEDSDTISFLLKQRINLARAYLRPSRIMLFDEASHSLGRTNDEAFVEVMHNLRGRATVLLATHREDHMRLADILLVMDKGELTHAGPPDQVLAALKSKR
jgi:ATP-binding cassette subfamily C protein/ATP-binding cassette subfamily C protein LapB